MYNNILFITIINVQLVSHLTYIRVVNSDTVCAMVLFLLASRNRHISWLWVGLGGGGGNGGLLSVNTLVFYINTFMFLLDTTGEDRIEDSVKTTGTPSKGVEPVPVYVGGGGGDRTGLLKPVLLYLKSDLQF